MSQPREHLLSAAEVRERLAASRAAASSLWRWRPSRTTALAFISGLLITTAFALTALAVYNRNERRLLHLRVRQLSLVLQATAPSIQTPLASAAELANATSGSPKKFRAFAAPYVGVGMGQFASISLWPLGARRLAPTAVVGSAPQLMSQPRKAGSFLGRPARSGVLNVIGLLASAHPSLGFEFSQPGHARGYAVYGEVPLPASRRSRLERSSAFSDLDYALYLGHSRRTADVIVTSEQRLPITGRTAAAAVPFGAGVYTLVVAPRGSLGGRFFQSLPWLIAGGGVLLTIAATVLTDRLVRRRQRAEELATVLDRVAAENRRMYTEQRSISQTLQHALLPERLPELSGLRVDARYVPAAAGVDVGGDWYDIVAMPGGQVVLVIGDVSGHGLRAATTMALLRHAALAYVAQDCRPGTVLARLADFVDRAEHDYFATVLCVLIDVGAHRLTIASAGHMAPLVLGNGHAEFPALDADAPIGVARSASYRETTVSVPQGAVVLAFTDGLVERRGEVIDVGLGRLRDLARNRQLALGDLLAELARDLTSEDHYDDAAMVGIQWRD
jgi:serine phosphatase RsbU (regulator of sigma subunit)